MPMMTPTVTPWTQNSNNPAIAYDLFPAEVHTPQGDFTKVRVLMTLGSSTESPKIYVF